MKSLWKQTRGEKIGTIDGLNLFFGALLGANLGTLQGVPLHDYVKLIVILAGTVAVLRTLSTSERRGYSLLVLALYVALLAFLFSVPDLQPEGLSKTDLQRLQVTLATWIGAVLIAELSPTHDDKPPPPADQD